MSTVRAETHSDGTGLASTAGQRTRSAQLGDVRQRNYSAIMQELMYGGPLARTDLAAAIGMSTSAVTKVTAVLAGAGVVKEARQSADGGMGRPKVPVDIDDSAYGAIGVHFGLRRTVVCLIGLKGRLVDEVHLPRDGTDFDSAVDDAVAAVREMAARAEPTVLGVGASTGGWVDSAGGTVRRQPALGWRDAPLARRLREAVGLPVVVESHTRALALAEHWFGAAVGVDNVLHLFVGNVVGVGLILNGAPYRGTSAQAGGIDHLPVAGTAGQPCDCGSRSCFKAVAGDLEVTRRARSAGLVGPDAEVHDVIALADAGDRRALSLLRDRAQVVGDAAATLIELLDPELVVVAGGVSAAPDRLAVVREAARARLVADRFPAVDVAIRSSAFGSHAIGIAAGAVLLDATYRTPTAYVPALATASRAKEAT